MGASMERNKKRNTNILNLRLSDEDYAKIQHLADGEQRSLPDMARLLFRRAFAAGQFTTVHGDPKMQPWDGIPATTPVMTWNPDTPTPPDPFPEDRQLPDGYVKFEVKFSDVVVEPAPAVAATLVWNGCEVRADGNYYEVCQLSSHVWQSYVNGTALGDWKTTEQGAKNNCSAEFRRRREARAVAKEHGNDA